MCIRDRGSIAFYTYGEAQYVLLLLASVTVNYVIARSMYKTPEDGRGRRQAVLLVLALCYDFGMLFFFKYSGLTTKLPLGISFYTFQIAAKGFQAASTAAGIKYKDRTDMAMIYSEVPCAVAGTFTTNIVKAAPVKWDQHVVYDSKKAQAVIVNAGIANACTGEEGMGYCKATAEKVNKLLQIPTDEVLVASTGVIGLSLIHISEPTRPY